MKINYTILWLLPLLSISLITAQNCPQTLGESSTDILVHFRIDQGDCDDFPSSIYIQGSLFDKKYCDATDLKYELNTGGPIPNYDTFSVDLGFGVCEYLNGEIRRETLGVENITETINSLRIYPNPVSSGDEININFNSNIDAEIMIYDLTGKLVMKDNISSSSTKSLNISTVNNGIYLLQIVAENSATSRKFVIMR
ncbi:MAG: T9SS type A sorting domain-containing protein [Flavobacteriaceae bacterium]|nr:T9SS type A sorting domain-containing protein [Bacteroidia bacterium]NNK86699.1 T9SS type A sorting domain-containing protein [Flavobacteriaceae bacterium]